MRRALIAVATASAIALASPVAEAQRRVVDLLLVLCMDASGSIDPEEFALQREGYADAVSDPRVVDAIRNGPIGATAIAVVEWGSPLGAATVVPWTEVRDSAGAAQLADRIVRAPRSEQSYNAIGDALDHASRLISAAPFEALRKVIDLSGDGPDLRSVNPAWRARNAAVEAGITVNALVVVSGGTVGPLEGGSLVEHYEHQVIGGPGAFVMTAEGRARFAEAILAKLVREIADVPGPRRATVADRPVAPAPHR